MAEGTLQRTHHTSCVFAISAYSMTSCAAMLQRDAEACAPNTRAAPSHALTITLTCPRSSARPHVWSDIGFATQTMKQAVRGARGTCLQTT